LSKYWSRRVRGLKPYVPGEQPQDKSYIKLNTNENPYPPSPKVQEAIKRAVDSKLKLYPDPEGLELRITIADYFGLKKEQVFVGNGSDEVLAFAFMAFFDPERPILFPDVTYSFYPVYARLLDLKYELVELNSDFTLPLDPFLKNNGGIIFPNPNAPTGIFTPLERVEKILASNLESVVIVDEAYIDFGGESAVRLLNKYPNLLIVQTLSKSRSLAGLRVGFALGSKDLIQGLNSIKNSINSYTLDRLALVGALEAFKDNDYFEETRKKIIATRGKTAIALKDLGFTALPSKTNFLLISHPILKAEDLFAELKERAILVRYFRLPRIDNFLRVSIGSEEEMKIFLENIKEIVLSV
jgi:histidinol-phosphate aminotransferase